MKDIIEKMAAKGDDELQEANYDNKSVYKELKGVVQSVDGALLAFNRIARSRWGKINKVEMAALEKIMLKASQVSRETRGIAAGIGVMAGK